MKDHFMNPPNPWNKNFDNYNNLYSSEIMNLLDFFNPDKNINSPLNNNQTFLSNSDFKSGTYRIKNPGKICSI